MKRMTLHPRLAATGLAGLLLAVASAASAQTAPTELAAQPDLGQEGTAAQVDTPTDPFALSQVADQQPGENADDVLPSNCLRYTGSRIRTAERKNGRPPCVQGPGRSFSRTDLNRTGQVDIADALRHLDPSIK